jgi:D-glycero-D-manno-heptose 1,7-bisphosphate phosphatase
MTASNKAIFLDRDGVINRNDDHYYVYSPGDFVINEGIMEFMQDVQKRGYLLIIISNQGGISKGLYTRNDTEGLHELLLEQCRRNNISISEIYYCPHSSKVEKCLCRKPLPLMLEKAMARFGIDPGQSWFIGDADRDSQAGKAAGLRTLQVKSNENLLPYLNKFR